jgi:hypothetical protein
MNAIDFIFREIAEATELYNINKDEAEDKLAKIARNISTASFLPNSDKEKMLNAIEMARYLMNNDKLMQNVSDDIEVVLTGKSNRLREMAKKFEQYNRDLHRKTQQMNHIIAGLQ